MNKVICLLGLIVKLTLLSLIVNSCSSSKSNFNQENGDLERIIEKESSTLSDNGSCYNKQRTDSLIFCLLTKHVASLSNIPKPVPVVLGEYIQDLDSSFSVLFVLEEALDLQRNNVAIRNLLLQYLTIHDRESILELAKIPDKVYFLKLMTRFACDNSYNEVSDIYRFLLSLNLFYYELGVELSDHDNGYIIGYGFFDQCVKGRDSTTSLSNISDSLLLNWNIEFMTSDSIQKAYNGIDQKYILDRVYNHYFEHNSE
jgi:hypothetical protein